MSEYCYDAKLISEVEKEIWDNWILRGAGRPEVAKAFIAYATQLLHHGLDNTRSQEEVSEIATSVIADVYQCHADSAVKVGEILTRIYGSEKSEALMTQMFGSKEIAKPTEE